MGRNLQSLAQICVDLSLHCTLFEMPIELDGTSLRLLSVVRPNLELFDRSISTYF
jgi:hypothetical protein